MSAARVTGRTGHWTLLIFGVALDAVVRLDRAGIAGKHGEKQRQHAFGCVHRARHLRGSRIASAASQELVCNALPLQ
jgi:hypothetical protein